ncbi:hypothetical protein LPW11_21120 [Geomonas sp. RF6]|uniref:hypothetical protein n=1 Tax=Geomonas sp. RF6 TaxID=2897342 RepID=UPI001E4DBA74|nr:hypothetical protein [Geomonas sp. RF6]UFS70356.1 hypothetical protein LPW11_21120 [Geomonas sp. RF6]
MGDLSLDESPGTISDLSRRGARFSLARSLPSGVVEFDNFAFTGDHPGDDRSVLIGTAARFTLLDKAQIRAVYVRASEMLEPGNWRSDARRRGDVVGVIARIDPYQGRLAFEGEADYALFDEDTSDAAPAVADTSCRAKLGGSAQGYRYSALYERTGPRYNIISGTEPRRDWEGYALGLGKEFGVHALELRLSRYNDNVKKNAESPVVYRYEGILEYNFKKIETLPLGFQYAKRVVQSVVEGGGRNGSGVDTIAGKMTYLAGEWDLGVRASYLQRRNLASEERDLAAATVALAPKFNAGDVTVAPDFSLKRSFYLLERQRSDEYWAGLDIRGFALGRQLDYQLRGGVRKVLPESASGTTSVGGNVRLAYPLKRLLGALSAPTLGVRGEFNGVSDSWRREGNYSLLVVLEGR